MFDRFVTILRCENATARSLRACERWGGDTGLCQGWGGCEGGSVGFALAGVEEKGGWERGG